MEVTARDIQEQQFHDAWRGYNQEEVDDFLDDVAETIDRLSRENDALRVRLRELEETAETAKATEGMLKKTLLSAQQTAQESISEAKVEAERILADAEERARRVDQDVRLRSADVESEAEQKILELQHRFDAKKGELEGAIGRLEAFEGEIKRRLRSFMEQQLQALETLQERERSIAQSVEAPSRPTETPQPVAEVEAPEPVAAEPDDTQAFDVAGMFDQESDVELPAEAESETESETEPEAEEDALPPAQAAAELQASQDGDEGDEIDLEDAEVGHPSVFDSLPQSDQQGEPSLEDFRPFDDDAAAVAGRRRRRLFRRRVDDWA